MKKDLKVLMIGNSFSICVGRYLPRIVSCQKKHRLLLTSTYIGGCSLEKHAGNLVAADNDKDFKPYTIDIWDSSDLRCHKHFAGNVNELLQQNKYDIVTVQQASLFSVDYNYYQPYADQIIEYIRKYNPDAKIYIQQTWAYRADSIFFNMDFPVAGLNPDTMHTKLTAAYKKFAEATGFPLIPVGQAVSYARENALYKYNVLSSDELAAYRYPDFPPFSGDVVGFHRWQKVDNVLTLTADSNHLNCRGEYLQACVWYGTLFDEDANMINFAAKDFPEEDAGFLRDCAARAVAEYKR